MSADNIPSTKNVSPHWISFVDSKPPTYGFYWLLGSTGYRLLAHWDGSQWRGMNAGGEPFKLADKYTYWTPISEPRK